MNTNHAGVTENAFAKIDKQKYEANFVHIFQKDKCECEECELHRKRKAILEKLDEMHAVLDDKLNINE